MGALHAQNSDGAEHRHRRHTASSRAVGPGKLESDLQSLISELSSTGSTSSSDSSDAVDQLESASPTCWTSWASAATASTDSTSSTSMHATKLAAFLQALSSKVGGNGTSGNLVNTTV
jgi:hypothetical protein